MTNYFPPVEDMTMLIYDVLGADYEDIDRETATAILDEAAKLSAEVLAPLNRPGDIEGASIDKDGNVKCASGFKQAYVKYCEGGWNSVPFSPEYGGQGLPWSLAFAIQEMWQGANMSFGLCPLLNQGAVEAISLHGSDEHREKYLPKLISGEWAGTMNITEPQAGSDLGLIRSKAEKQADGTYKISGQKIFITYGDHDLTDNIIHLVLARVTGAPDDVKGLSLFIVPKIMEDGSKNKLSCIGLEHKLGIHASPTCTMEYEGACGYLVGQENMGLKYMFTMMNNARLCVGLQGVAIAERAYQAASIYASERIQGKSFASGERVEIARHGDVRRMLTEMKSYIMASRALTLEAGIALDKLSGKFPDLTQEQKAAAQERVNLLTPLVKAWSTDIACDVTSTAIQVHGGMGFIEETGVAQYYRDARILPIYEGTNGIQAADLAFRKLLFDQGKAVKSYINEISDYMDQDYIDNLSAAGEYIISLGESKDMDLISFNSVNYLRAFAIIAGASLMERIRKVCQNPSRTSQNAVSGISVEDCADYYKKYILPQATAYLKPLLVS